MPSIQRIQNGLLVFGAIYAAFVGMLLHPSVQRSVFYLHQIKYPFFLDTTAPAQHGFHTDRVESFFLNDGGVHAWHVAPLTQLRSAKPMEIKADAKLVIFLHGTAATIAAPHRLTTYRMLSLLPNVHVLAIDYRGFGRASGTPSEAGLLDDTVAAFSWAVEKGFSRGSITLLGQSLGSAVAIGGAERILDDQSLAPYLSQVIAAAPFYSGATIVRTYKVSGIFPVLGPLSTVPGLHDLLTEFLYESWDSAARVARIAGRVKLIFVHSKLDYEIAPDNSARLFDVGLQALHPDAADAGDRLKRVDERKLPDGGFERKSKDGQLVHLEAHWGGHNLVNWVDDVLVYI